MHSFRRARPATSAATPTPGVRTPAAGKERAEEIGERVFVAKEFLHFLRRHRAVAAALPAAAHIHVPFAAAKGRARSGAAARALGLLVHLPVGAELVVFL